MRDHFGNSALTRAARFHRLRYLEVCQVLLAAGADPNATNVHGKSALYFAAERGDEPLVGLLARAGATGGMAVAAALGMTELCEQLSELYFEQQMRQPQPATAAAACALTAPSLPRPRSKSANVQVWSSAENLRPDGRAMSVDQLTDDARDVAFFS